MPRPAYINLNRARDNQKFALEMFTQYGITAFRMSKDGQIAWIKDANFGWMSAERWSLGKRVVDMLQSSVVEKIIEGGYRINEALYGAEVSAATVTVPVGKIIVIASVTVLIASLKAGDLETVALILAGLVAPFGAIILLWMFAEWVEHFMSNGETLNLGEIASFNPVTGLSLKYGGVEWSPLAGFLEPVLGALFPTRPSIPLPTGAPAPPA